MFEKCSTCIHHHCCDNCFSQNGYLTKDIEKFKKEYGFSEKGFLGKNGCLIPREKRSKLCNDFYCE